MLERTMEGDEHMITREQALKLHYRDEIHNEELPCGGKYSNTWRVNGLVQTWKRDVERFRVPIKFGLRGYGEITELNSDQFHLASECPHR